MQVTIFPFATQASMVGAQPDFMYTPVMLTPTDHRPPIEQILKDRFGLDSFRPGQLDVIRSVLERRDTLAVMPTGSGKSLCYQLPALHFGGLVLVISPLIALMNDQVRTLNQYGIPAGCLHSAQTLAEKRAVFTAIRSQSEFILYLSPERIQSPGFADWIKEQRLSLIAVDEAHCVSQWGPDFRQDYHRLNLLRELLPETPILALTATATPPVLADISRQLRLKDPARHVHGFYRSNLFYQIEPCPDENHRWKMICAALDNTPEGRVLIYGGTRQKCEDLAARLQTLYLGVGFYHAGMTADQRRTIQEKLDNNELRILVATNAFGMGVDYPNVRLVVHIQLPANVESLYQEMGRAGRDQKMSRCLLLYSRKDRGLHAFFINQSKAESKVIQRRWSALNAITEFVESNECRHGGILTYFRDANRIQACGHCDVCAPNSEWIVRTPEEEPLTIEPGLRPTPKRGKKTKSHSEELLSPDAESRALILKDWRKRYARENDLPAFMIFSDRTLKDLANKNPSSLTGLQEVYGMGPAKIEMFGPLLLEELGYKQY